MLWAHELLVLAVGEDTPVNFVPVNNADNWLHLILGVGMIALGLLLSPHTATRSDQPPPADRTHGVT